MKTWIIIAISVCVLVSNDISVAGKGPKNKKGKGKKKGKKKGKGHGHGHEKGHGHGHGKGHGHAKGHGHGHGTHEQGHEHAHGNDSPSAHGPVCHCESPFSTIQEAYDKSPIIFWAKVLSKQKKKENTVHKVNVLQTIKGCFLKKEIRVVSEKHCPVQLSAQKTYLITAKDYHNKDILISSCFPILEKKKDMSSYASTLFWLNSQMGTGCDNETICADGSNPLKCLKCPDTKKEIQKMCPIAESCEMNRCNACRPQFYDQAGKRVCDMCPPGQPPKPCPEGKSRCSEATLPSSCEASYCVPNSCGSCTTLWIDDFGKQVCKSESVFNQCHDMTAIDFGTCDESATLEKIGIINGVCSSIQGCSSVLNQLPLFESIDDCKMKCQAATVEIGLPSERNTSLCDFPHDPHCCPDNHLEEECILKNLQMFCKYVKCEGAQVAHCTANPCEQCTVRMKDANNNTIDPATCSLELPDYNHCTAYAEVTCHETDEPDCGSLPSACPSNWNARCVTDACSCKPIWMNEDVRNPKEECLRSLVAECVVEEECPKEFTCLPPKEEIMSRRDFSEGFGLQCIQEPCTCVPMWHMYDINVGPLVIPGFTEICKEEEEECCEVDGQTFKPKNCTQVLEINDQMCKDMTCDADIDRSTCSADVCNDCNLQVKSKSGDLVDMKTCSFRESPTSCDLTPAVDCNMTGPYDCGPYPVACPKDWNIKCVLDPCVCRPYWFDMDVRFTKETCKMALEPPCIPYEECPIFNCTDLTEEQQSLISQRDQDLMECVPQPCTCRPIWVSQYAGYSNYHKTKLTR